MKKKPYYGVGVNARPTLAVGRTVHAKMDDTLEWHKAQINEMLPYRSFTIQLDDGTTRRRTSMHIRFWSEPAIVFQDDDMSSATPDQPQPPVAPVDHLEQAGPTTVNR